MDTESDAKLIGIFDGITALAAGIGALLRALDEPQRASAYRLLAYQRDTAPADRPSLAKVLDVMIVDPSR